MSNFQHEIKDTFPELKFVETCEKCNNPLTVHAHRRKGKGKKEIVYCSCLDRSCRQYGREIGFIR